MSYLFTSMLIQKIFLYDHALFKVKNSIKFEHWSCMIDHFKSSLEISFSSSITCEKSRKTTSWRSFMRIGHIYPSLISWSSKWTYWLCQAISLQWKSCCTSSNGPIDYIWNFNNWNQQFYKHEARLICSKITKLFFICEPFVRRSNFHLYFPLFN